MENNDKLEFLEQFAIMVEACGARDIQPARAEAYFMLLKEFPLEEVKKGMYEASKGHQITNTLPLSGDIVRYMGQDKDELALTAYMKLKESYSHHYSDLIVFDDPILSQAITALGGLQTCWQEVFDSPQFFRKEFARTYKSLLENKEAYQQIGYHLVDPVVGVTSAEVDVMLIGKDKKGDRLLLGQGESLQGLADRFLKKAIGYEPKKLLEEKV